VAAISVNRLIKLSSSGACNGDMRVIPRACGPRKISVPP
jgi:hypothetical protein